MPEKGWMLLRELVTRTFTNGRSSSLPDYAIANRDSHQLTSGLLVQAAAWSSSPMMAPGAEAVCSTLVPGGSNVLRCWNIPSGKVIPLARDLMDYRVTQASRTSP